MTTSIGATAGPPLPGKQESRKHRWLRGRRLVLPAAVVTQGLALVRNMLVARLLGPQQFGTAAGLLLASQFLDAALDSGLNKFVLSDRQGSRRSVAATVQFVAIVRGISAALLILLFAKPLLHFLAIDLSTPAIALLACSPLIGSAVHYDIVRFQKAGNLGFDSTVQIAGEVCGILCAVTVAYLTGSYIAVLAGWIARSLAQVTVSHLLADRPYEVKLSRATAARIILYSSPLLINGPLLFLSVQADRVMVAKLLGTLDLGIYAAALVLVSSPATVALRATGTTFLPMIATARFTPAGADQEIHGLRAIALVGCLLMMFGFGLVGPAAIPFLYGGRFQTEASVIAAIGVLQAIRFVRVWPSTQALANGHTLLELSSNLIRLVGVPLAILAVAHGYGLFGLVAAFCVGEFVSLAFSTIWLAVLSGHLTRTFVALASVAAVALTTAHAWLGTDPIRGWAIATLAFAVAMALTFSPMLKAVRTLWSPAEK